MGRFYDDTKKYEEAIEVFDMAAREVSMVAEKQQVMAFMEATAVNAGGGAGGDDAVGGLDGGGAALCDGTNASNPPKVTSVSSFSSKLQPTGPPLVATAVPIASSSIQTNIENNHLQMYNQLLSNEKAQHNHHHHRTHMQIYSADIEKEVANVLFSLKRYDEALERYQHAYTILKRALGENHPKAARAIWGKGKKEDSPARGQGQLQRSVC